MLDRYWGLAQILAVNIDCEFLIFGVILTRIKQFRLQLMYKIFNKIYGGRGLVFQDRYFSGRINPTAFSTYQMPFFRFVWSYPYCIRKSRQSSPIWKDGVFSQSRSKRTKLIITSTCSKIMRLRVT